MQGITTVSLLFAQSGNKTSDGDFTQTLDNSTTRNKKTLYSHFALSKSTSVSAHVQQVSKGSHAVRNVKDYRSGSGTSEWHNHAQSDSPLATFNCVFVSKLAIVNSRLIIDSIAIAGQAIENSYRNDRYLTKTVQMNKTRARTHHKLIEGRLSVTTVTCGTFINRVARVTVEGHWRQHRTIPVLKYGFSLLPAVVSLLPQKKNIYAEAVYTGQSSYTNNTAKPIKMLKWVADINVFFILGHSRELMTSLLLI